MLDDLHIKAADLIGNRDKIKQIKPTQYTNEQFGLPTILDILAELEKPGRDPRGESQTATFTEGVNEIKDLKPFMDACTSLRKTYIQKIGKDAEDMFKAIDALRDK